MENFGKNFIALLVLGIVLFVFRSQIEVGYLTVRDKVFPCAFPVRYSIGEIDSRFNLTKDEFLYSVKRAEGIWEEGAGQQLFTYDPDGFLKISLIYDDRQEATETMKDIGSNIDNGKDSYDYLKSKYNKLLTEYQQDRNNIKTNEDVNLLNQKIDMINDLARKINESARNVNNQVRQYNNLGRELGDEFEEGIYHSDEKGREIIIYHFEDEENLIRLLMHELGHAIQLGHLEDSEAIMFRLNIKNNLNLSASDLAALKKQCKIK